MLNRFSTKERHPRPASTPPCFGRCRGLQAESPGFVRKSLLPDQGVFSRRKKAFSNTKDLNNPNNYKKMA